MTIISQRHDSRDAAVAFFVQWLSTHNLLFTPPTVNPDIPVYDVYALVQPLEGCELDPKEFQGAYVRCYVPAYSEAEAMILLEEAFSSDGFRLRATRWCVREDLVEWEKPDDPGGLAIIEEARNSGEVVYGDFFAWPHDDPDGFQNDEDWETAFDSEIED